MTSKEEWNTFHFRQYCPGHSVILTVIITDINSITIISTTLDNQTYPNVTRLWMRLRWLTQWNTQDLDTGYPIYTLQSDVFLRAWYAWYALIRALSSKFKIHFKTFTFSPRNKQRCSKFSFTRSSKLNRVKKKNPWLYMCTYTPKY